MKQAQEPNQAIIHVLHNYPPFSLMEADHIRWLLGRAKKTSFSAGEVVYAPTTAVPPYWYILYQGTVEERPQPDVDNEVKTLTHSVGAHFPLTAILQSRPAHSTYIALEDCACLALNVEDLAQLLTYSSALHRYAMQGVSAFLSELQQAVQAQAYAQLGAHHSLHTPLRQLAKRTPVRCLPETPLQHAIMIMHTYQVGSVMITDHAQHPVGIFTLRDLRRVLAAATDNPLTQPVSQFMIPDPICLRPQDTAFDAALVMTQHHIGHIGLIEHEELVGVVSERDLFALQRIDLVHLARALRKAPNLQRIQQLRQEIFGLVKNMLAHGAEAQQITQVLTQLNDHITVRCIELVLANHPDLEIPFNWLVLGSQARQEHTLLARQQNAILFVPRETYEPDQERQILLPIALEINAALEACGLKLCPQQNVAAHPELCLTPKEWQQLVAQPLNNSLFFDMRVLWGPELGAHHLQQQMRVHSTQSPESLRNFIQAALNYPTPPSQLRTWFARTTGQPTADLDLKQHLLAPMAEAARVLSIIHQCFAATTAARFAALAQQGVITAEQAEQWSDAYHYLNLLRLQQQQQQAERHEPLSDLIFFQDLNAMQQQMLKEVVSHTRALQSQLTHSLSN